MKSKKENSLDSGLIGAVEGFGLSGKAVATMQFLLHDEELQTMQEYANTVSIVRLGYNDHGPVHMKIVAMNAMKMFRLLRQAEGKTSLETDGCGTFEDSLTGVLCAAMLHDLGMSIMRQEHEFHGAYFALPIIDRVFKEVYGSDLQKRVMIKALVLESITGHMGTRPVHTLEAGVLQVADGCDMTKGRARIPIAMGLSPRVGDIHQYSANSIEKVFISAGQEKPIRVEVHMSAEVGFFQVEEVLLKKIAGSTAKPYIELYAQVQEEEAKRYL